jgi:hypothetical protein
VGCSVDKITLSSNADCCQDVISGTHHLANVCLGQFIQNAGSARLELVFKNDKSNKFKVRLGFSALHFLNLNPIQLCDVLGGTGNDSEASVGIIGKQLFVITWN